MTQTFCRTNDQIEGHINDVGSNLEYQESTTFSFKQELPEKGLSMWSCQYMSHLMGREVRSALKQIPSRSDYPWICGRTSDIHV